MVLILICHGNCDGTFTDNSWGYHGTLTDNSWSVMVSKLICHGVFHGKQTDMSWSLSWSDGYWYVMKSVSVFNL